MSGGTKIRARDWGLRSLPLLLIAAAAVGRTLPALFMTRSCDLWSSLSRLPSGTSYFISSMCVERTREVDMV
jgi:hypothetical protein